VLIMALAAMTGLAATDTPPDTCSSPAAAPELISPARHYSLKLNTLYTPQVSSTGLLVKARINGGPVLRMLLDSGASFIVLDKRAAGASGQLSGSSLELASVGSTPKRARRVECGTVQIGELVLRDCNILAVDTKLLEGIDGIIPMALFAGFLLHLDVPGKTLDLEPYPTDPPIGDPAYSPARADHCLIYLSSVLNESRTGYVLLDTGATYSAVSEAAASSWKDYRAMSRSISLRAGAGDTEGFLLPGGVRFRFGSRVLSVDRAVVVDLSEASRHNQFEVDGILGYSALLHSIVTINYRDSLVRIDEK
jgi:hypothetical protein